MRHFEKDHLSKAENFKKEVQIKAWTSRDMRALIAGAAREAGLTREDWIIKQLAASLSIAIPKPHKHRSSDIDRFSDPSSPTNNRQTSVGLRLEPALHEALKDIVQAVGVSQNDWVRAAIVKALREGLDTWEELETLPTDKP